MTVLTVKYAPAAIRTRVPRSGGEGDIHYTTRATSPSRAWIKVLPSQALEFPFRFRILTNPEVSASRWVLNGFDTAQHHAH